MERVYPLTRPLSPAAWRPRKSDGQDGNSPLGPGEAVHNGVADCEATRNDSAGYDEPARHGKGRQEADAGEGGSVGQVGRLG